MKVILFLTSIVLFGIISPFAFLFGLIAKHRSFKGYLLKIAISVDQLGNVVCSPLFDLILITSDKFRFGNVDETISSVLGKNKKNNSLSWLGKFISWILNKLDKNHVEKSIEENP